MPSLDDLAMEGLFVSLLRAFFVWVEPATHYCCYRLQWHCCCDGTMRKRNALFIIFFLGSKRRLLWLKVDHAMPWWV
eukprot:scaffold27204_cov268-Skeletonema_menzelii.AAC.2